LEPDAVCCGYLPKCDVEEATAEHGKEKQEDQNKLEKLVLRRLPPLHLISLISKLDSLERQDEEKWVCFSKNKNGFFGFFQCYC
jgi:hypothetical protein